MTDSLTCPKCSGDMARGYVADFAYGHVRLSEWTRGEPRPKSVLGLLNGIQEIGRPTPIATFRCEACGYLESYARDEFKPKDKEKAKP